MADVERRADDAANEDQGQLDEVAADVDNSAEDTAASTEKVPEAAASLGEVLGAADADAAGEVPGAPDESAEAAAALVDAVQDADGEDGRPDGGEVGSDDTVVAADDVANPPHLEDTPKRRSLPQAAWIAISCVALVIGLLIGRFALNGSGASQFVGRTTVAEDELDDVYATYSYEGVTGTVTVRDAIKRGNTIENSTDAEGNYVLPSADNVLAVVRDRILEQEAAGRGLAVDDEALTAFAMEAFGTSDFATLASYYGMTEDEVKEALTSSCLIGMLRDEVVEETASTEPEPPAAPEGDAAQDSPTKEYADYIISLAGDEWDAEKGTWATADGDYATALSDFEVTEKGATYDAALAAYYVAYGQYSTEAQAASTQWTDYVNSLFSNATIEISTLLA